jgi:3-deoxy-D-manno-octulosonate 8-phosphate phosphatase (KDO 8-P phosphatase)
MEPSPQMPSRFDLREAAQRAKGLRWMFFDVDGVMTDGGLFYSANGETMKRFNVLDGHGLKALRHAGIRLGILSGRSHPATEVRARELGFDVVIQGAEHKGAAFDQCMAEFGIAPADCGHMGDDLPDLEIFSRVHFAATVPDAAQVRCVTAATSLFRRGNEAARMARQHHLRRPFCAAGSRLLGPK